MIKKFLKKYWIILIFALIINIPIVILGTIRTNKDIMLPGDTQNIKGFISIDNDYTEKGSFSSIYVVDFEHSTKLQNLLLKNNKTAEISDLNLNYNQLSDMELYQAGQIQKNSSIQKAIILAYQEAKKIDESINIDHIYRGLQITYYSQNSKLRIGDFIIKINDVSKDIGYIDFRKELINNLFDDDNTDTFTILRDSKEYVFTEEEIDHNNFGCYDIFNIDYQTINPKATIKSTNVGGPSGGLLQTLSIYNRLTSFDYTNGLKIAGTGTMSLSGKVGEIGGIKQKIYTAYADNVDVFFCPKENYYDALIAYNNLENKEKMVLVKVEYLKDALEYLEALNV